jgi:hypothetical protein
MSARKAETARAAARATSRPAVFFVNAEAQEVWLACPSP